MIPLKIDASSSGANTVLAAITGRRIRVLDYVYTVAGSVTVTWKSGTTAISGPVTHNGAGEGVSSPASISSMGWLPKLVTAPGEALVLSLGGAVQVGGHLTYDVID